MSERLEAMLGAGHDVRLGKRDVHEVLQKLRARGAGSEAADRLESRLADRDEVVLPRAEAEQLLEELRASGRRWVFGTTEPREPLHRPQPEPEPEPEPKRRRFWRFRPSDRRPL
jgi:hypothetical protein